MNDDSDDAATSLPPRSPQWMQAAVGRPFQELDEGVQNWVEETELDFHYGSNQDIKHCELELAGLQAKRHLLPFENFEVKRSFLVAKIHATKFLQQKLMNAKPNDRLITLAWILEDQKSARILAKPTSQHIDEPPPSIVVVMTKRAKEERMLEWLIQVMRCQSDPTSKAVILEQAKEAGIPEVSGRAFGRIWGDAARMANSPKWAGGGRRKQSPRLITA